MSGLIKSTVLFFR